MSLNIAIIGGGPPGVFALQTSIAAPESCFITPGSLPFRTLRAKICDAQDALETILTDTFGLNLSPGEPSAIYLAAISFLIAQHPFIQGRPGSHEVASTVCANLLKCVTEQANIPAA